MLILTLESARPPAGMTFIPETLACKANNGFWTVCVAISHGLTVPVLEIAGHGQEQTPPAKITTKTYRDKVVTAITAMNGPVKLVGPNLDVINAVADSIPEHI